MRTKYWNGSKNELTLEKIPQTLLSWSEELVATPALFMPITQKKRHPLKASADRFMSPFFRKHDGHDPFGLLGISWVLGMVLKR